MTLSLESVSHRYAGSTSDSVFGASFSLRPKERLAIIGESGSGKSTLLAIMAGLLNPNSGVASLNGQRISSIPAACRNIALTLQTPPQMPGVRVGELLLRPASRNGAHDARRRVQAALAAVGMEGAFDRRLDALSGGERQRCFLARTLVWEPKIILLDEPFSSLDALTKRAIIPQLLTHQERTGASLAVITHDADEASLLAERFILLSEGVLVSQGPTASASTDPLSAFGAVVFGSLNTNLVPGTLRGSEGNAELEIMDAVLRGTYSGELREKIVLAIDASALELTSDGPTLGASIPLPASLRWIPVRSGQFVAATFPFGPIYARTSHLTAGAKPRVLLLQQRSFPVFDMHSQARIGTYRVNF